MAGPLEGAVLALLLSKISDVQENLLEVKFFRHGERVTEGVILFND